MPIQNNVRATIIIRNDSASNWATQNPKLSKGEMGVEIDTGLIKIGDGVLNYNSLPYINNGQTSVDDRTITIYNNKITLAEFGKEYWEYDSNLDEFVKRSDTDLTHWDGVELQIKNGVARWIKPRVAFNKETGVINGAFVTLARDPLSSMEAATKNYVDVQIQEKIAEAGHLTRSVVTQLPAEPEENVIYMIKDNNAPADRDQYKEYMVINNVLTQIGDTSVDLSNYVQKSGTVISGHLPVFDANGNLVDSNITPSSAGELQPATVSTLGGVLSTENTLNAVQVNTFGNMYVQRVSTSILEVPTGDELILNGGEA